MAESQSTTIVQLFNDWEVELLILLSFALQVFLFYFGGLRRRSNDVLLRSLLWLAYLSADSIAICALGSISRNLPTTSTTTENSKLSNAMSQQLKVLWAPFLLVHLGGQDTLTAFSVEDNELWLRHLLNLIVQASLVLYVLLKPVAYGQLVVPAIFVFVTGIIKYVERIWALKCGSMEYLKSSSRGRKVWSPRESVVLEDGPEEVTYPIIVKRAADCEQGVRHLFTGWQVSDMSTDAWEKFKSSFQGEILDSQLVYKRIEVELSIMYDNLFTKARIIHTTLGTILRCISLASTVLAFVLFIVMVAKQRYKLSVVDTAITYVLFTGALCLEACAVFILMMSPQTCTSLEARGGWCHVIYRLAWYILVKMQPETRPWWSNSMGQYNLLSSCMVDKKSSMFSTAIAKMMGMVGAYELWNKWRHTKHVKVPTESKQLVDEIVGQSWVGRQPLRLPDSLSLFTEVIDRLPFDAALLEIHIWTDFLLHKARTSMAVIPEEMQKHMDQCKVTSEYMIYLLVVNPSMLPVNSRAGDLLVNLWTEVRSRKHIVEVWEILSVVEGFFDEESRRILETGEVEGGALQLLLEDQDFHAIFENLAQVWSRLLIYAAGKCRPEEHARRLAIGGELLTHVWLYMLHERHGDQGIARYHLMPPADQPQVPGRSTIVNFPLFCR